MFPINKARMRNVPEQQLLFPLPELNPNPASNYLFFALLPEADDAARIVQLRERLCHEHGLKGAFIATNLLHISLHGVGPRRGLPRSSIEAAKEAAAKVSMRWSLDIVFDRAMSFNRQRKDRAFVLRTGNDVALRSFYRQLGEAMKSVGFRWVISSFTPHMTLLYADRIVKERAIDPVRWTAHDFVLVQSRRCRGHSEYEHLARWTLRG
jgi:2'-5' RNA ligase